MNIFEIEFNLEAFCNLLGGNRKAAKVILDRVVKSIKDKYQDDVELLVSTGDWCSDNYFTCTIHSNKYVKFERNICDDIINEIDKISQEITED